MVSHWDCLPPRADVLDLQGASVTAQGFVGEQSPVPADRGYLGGDPGLVD